MKIRGTAQQVYEKYLSLARDALSAGDRIAAEGYFQFADHYFRIVSAANGNGQGRPDRNSHIPPPPESAAGQFGTEDGEPGDMMDDGDGDESDAGPAGGQMDFDGFGDSQPASRSGDGFPRRKDRQDARSEGDCAPATDRFAAEVAGAEPASQAEELAQALSRADAPAADADAAADEAEDASKRRRRSPLGINRKRPAGRPRKAAEGEAPASEPEAAADNSGVMKTVRRGPRKPAAKVPDPAPENA